MPVEVIGIDHVFVAVRDMDAAKGFYERVMPILGFRRGNGSIGGDPHVFYHGRQLVYALRPAREGAATTPTRPVPTTSALGWSTRRPWTARPES